MGILLIILLLLIAGLCLVLLFKSLKWVVQKKERWYWMLAVLITITIGVTVNKLFFIKMEFIQSNVYPHVYLVKNQIENKDSLQVIIKKMVVQKMNNQINGTEEILKTKYKYAYRSVPEINSSIRFYEYYKALGVIPFGEAGTAHFIDNEEDPGGFTSELLQHYRTYKMAEFSLHYCENDTTNYFGKLTYWKNGEIIKTETLFNSCKNE